MMMRKTLIGLSMFAIASVPFSSNVAMAGPFTTVGAYVIKMTVPKAANFVDAKEQGTNSSIHRIPENTEGGTKDRTASIPQNLTEYSCKWEKTLTESEIIALNGYTKNTYVGINQNLRSGSNSSHFQKLANIISKGLRKFKLKDDIIVFRGVDYIFEVPIENLKGHIHHEKGFSSTSVVRGHQFKRNVQMKINVPTYATGAYIAPLSTFKNEYEFLLDKGMEMEISDYRLENGVLHITAKALGTQSERIDNEKFQTFFQFVLHSE